MYRTQNRVANDWLIFKKEFSQMKRRRQEDLNKKYDTLLINFVQIINLTYLTYTGKKFLVFHYKFPWLKSRINNNGFKPKKFLVKYHSIPGKILYFIIMVKRQEKSSEKPEYSQLKTKAQS